MYIKRLAKTLRINKYLKADNYYCHFETPRTNSYFQIALPSWIIIPKTQTLNKLFIETSAGNNEVLFEQSAFYEKQFNKVNAYVFTIIINALVYKVLPKLTLELSSGVFTKTIDTQITFEPEKFKQERGAKAKLIENLFLCPSCKTSIQLIEKGDIVCEKCKTLVTKTALGTPNFLTEDLRLIGGVKPAAIVSSNLYDNEARRIIEAYKDGVILDCGSGLRSIYYSNVVNYEIVDYPSTDVIGIAECLPFKDNSFDAIFSFAVLEHVKDPFKAAKELERVLKPNGEIYIAVPFLQPFHGYPNHYYNMTLEGLKNLFSEDIAIENEGVPKAGLPVWGLSWILNSYLKGLPPKTAKKFKKLKVKQLIKNPESQLENDYVTLLDRNTNIELASVNYLVAKKTSTENN